MCVYVVMVLYYILLNDGVSASEYESRISAYVILINLVITVNIFASQFFLNISLLTWLTYLIALIVKMY